MIHDGGVEKLTDWKIEDERRSLVVEWKKLDGWLREVSSRGFRGLIISVIY